MTLARFLLMFCLAAVLVVPASAEDLHLHETGSSAVFARSAFAHGYRHGYEEGYHLGNSDINMGSEHRTSFKKVHGLKLGYSSQFGSRSVFEKGFHAGLRIGYHDGYSGHSFRAIGTLGSLAASLEKDHSSADPKFVYFDQGFFAGYNDGIEHGGHSQPSTAKVDFRAVGCSNFHPAKQSDQPAKTSYCEGYQRGFALGAGDSAVLGPDVSRLEASK